MLNKVTLIGHLGQDPETRFMPNGNKVTNISLATSRRWKDKTTGEKRETTEWHRVIFFNKLAEVVGEYCHKGSQLYLEGRLQTRKWTGQDGQDRYTTEILADTLHMLGGRRDNAGAAAPQPDDPPSSHNTAPPPDTDEYDDDIPF